MGYVVEVAVMTYKSLNDLAPLYLKICLLGTLAALCELYETLRVILKLPLKKTSSGQSGF